MKRPASAPQIKVTARKAAPKAKVLKKPVSKARTADAPASKTKVSARKAAPRAKVLKNPVSKAGTAVKDLFAFLWRGRRHLPKMSSEMTVGLRSRLDLVQGSDLGISPKVLARLRSGIGYQDVYNGPDMSICIFALRAGSRLPLHDHPGMTVFSRLLFGRMRVTSFDIKSKAARPEWPSGHTAVLHSDKVLGPHPVTYSLGPDEGNLHTLEAIDDCAFFDVLTPPYNPAAGRDCSFFLPIPKGADEEYILQPTFPDYYTETMKYRGPTFPCNEP
eukprot:gnl/TRDRNA2_/TRDRNA2_127365_c0_seq2.p1 gnl/TRDRNA2_/TRDRNA2_127365_c0~~gnl/TRDRNA2_/TRDRNA2_127365_c0_seq2.p1  ORF type:complete len:274 (-),score=30.93 gnl/TRDRNA2_/TRDRNA2_127365_c0_seq2:145-966(-)